MGTSHRQPVAALRASEVAIPPQPCEGRPLAQAGSPRRSRLRRDDVVSRRVRFSVTTLSGQEARPTLRGRTAGKPISLFAMWGPYPAGLRKVGRPRLPTLAGVTEYHSVGL